MAFRAAVVPYLLLLNRLLGAPEHFIGIAVPLALAAVIYIWAVCFLFIQMKRNRWNAGAAALLLAMPLQAAINLLLAKLIDEPLFDVWDLLSYLLLGLLAFVCFQIGRLRARGDESKNEPPVL